MTERQIECFLTLSQTLSFRRTAERLYLTQPAVSQQIRALEESLGTPLFYRDKGRVSLTPAGIAFREGAREYLAYTNALVQRVQRAKNNYTELRDLFYMMPLRKLPEILSAYHAQFPRSFVRLFPTEAFKSREGFFLSPNSLGVAFGSTDTAYEEVRYTELYRGPVVCLLPSDHPLAGRQRLTVEDLAYEPVYLLKEEMDCPFLHRLFHFVSLNHPYESLTPCASFFELASMAHGGFGVSVTPFLQTEAHAGCACVPFDYPEEYSLGIFTHRDCPADVQALVEIARRICAEDPASPVQL